MLHTPPVHLAAPFGSVGHTVHAIPHAVASLSAGHRSPHLWVPVPQSKSHLVPSHLACVAPAGTGHGVHDVPHALMSITDGHSPLHRCCPGGHALPQLAAASTQAPRHSCLPVPQLPPHDVPLHVAVPSVGS